MSSTRPDAGRIRVAGIENDSITDGPGLRLTLFVQGCPRACPGCHNPESIPLEGGRWYSAEELFGRICKNPILTGVTFSGGEPLSQAVSLLPLAKMIRQEKLDLAIYTGYVFEDILAHADPNVLALLSLADILIDGPFVIKQRNLSLRFRGSENQRILDLPRSLAEKKAIWTEDPDWLGDKPG
ncbi:MAG: anaerobic ribonucleoside-triphosphate reductase activating protein [Alistipes senegalensis]|nr:anaerobic ribonucleoside-triphosphate reductase activating protein [Oxalobacter formigenes]MCM1281050.1 anaerobic ribonucleoside-triphosphate reductase activating protein [Alistipes senegalensis]